MHRRGLHKSSRGEGDRDCPLHRDALFILGRGVPFLVPSTFVAPIQCDITMRQRICMIIGRDTKVRVCTEGHDRCDSTWSRRYTGQEGETVNDAV